MTQHQEEFVQPRQRGPNRQLQNISLEQKIEKKNLEGTTGLKPAGSEPNI